MATVTDDSALYYYNSNIPGEEVPRKFSVKCDDDVLTLGEINSHVSITQPSTRCTRCPLSLITTPDLSVMCKLAETTFDPTHDVILIEDGNVNNARCHFATCLTLLARGYGRRLERTIDLEAIEFTNRAVDVLINASDDGRQCKEEVDWLLSTIANSTGANTIHDKLIELSNKQTRKVKQEVWLEEDVYITQLYVFLITFNIYCHSQWQLKDRVLFSTWMKCSSKFLPILRATLFPLPLLSDTSISRFGKALVLVNNSNRDEDHLCTYSSNGCANLRKIPGLPIYGVCQPSRKGFESLSKWLMTKFKHTSVTLISVREDVSVMCDGEVYCLRYKSQPHKSLSLHQTSSTELYKLQSLIKSTLEHTTSMSQFFHNSKSVAESPEIQAPIDAYLSVEKTTFLQIPIPLDKSPSVSAFQQIQKIASSIFHDFKETGEQAALVFCCGDGRDRTTTAMSIAGLVWCNATSYGYGAAKGEAERISIWDAQYTKGEFQVIQGITATLPGGHQSKREVDYILDQCFETSSMMHYHVREEIFVIFKKARKMKQTLQQQGDNDEGICIRGPKKGTGIETDLASYCKALHRKSLDNLERYAMLIIFNAYLNRVKMYTDDHLAAPDECVTASFEKWISEVGFNSGILSILDDLSFKEFEDICSLKSRINRNCKYQKP